LTETMSFLMCSLLYTFISFERKKDSQGGSQVGSQGGSLSARSFDLARPGLAPPLDRVTDTETDILVNRRMETSNVYSNVFVFLS